jgi:hypothetical protein
MSAFKELDDLLLNLPLASNKDNLNENLINDKGNGDQSENEDEENESENNEDDEENQENDDDSDVEENQNLNQVDEQEEDDEQNDDEEEENDETEEQNDDDEEDEEEGEEDEEEDEEDEEEEEEDDEEVDKDFECEMTLEDIQSELQEITELANRGLEFSERRFDYLLKAQSCNIHYRREVEEEKEEWLESIEDFTQQCLERSRTFVPVNIFAASHEGLLAMGLSDDLAKRVLQRKCLWLVRMSRAEIARLHVSDLYNRYNTTAQHLDIIETAAIYASLPKKYDPLTP